MAKKDKKTKVPKRIAGVKVPKDLRKKAKVALGLAENPIVRELAAAALTAAAGALAASGQGKRAGAKAADQAGEAANEAKRAGSALKAAATDIALSMLDAFEASLREAAPKRSKKAKAPSDEA